jgi:hypothetical protein
MWSGIWRGQSFIKDNLFTSSWTKCPDRDGAPTDLAHLRGSDEWVQSISEMMIGMKEPKYLEKTKMSSAVGFKTADVQPFSVLMYKIKLFRVINVEFHRNPLIHSIWIDSKFSCI